MGIYTNISPLYTKKDLCNLVKFIAALLVVNGHIFLFGGTDSKIAGFMNLGACCVSVFFFFSGYGLTYNITRKGSSYLSGFLTKRLIRIILPLITAYAVALTVYSIVKGHIDIKTVISTLLWGGPYLKFSWYVTEIIVIYIIFYLIMKISISYDCRILILCGVVLLLACILFILKQPIWYIESLPCFIIGVYYQRFELNIDRFNVTSIIPLIVIWGCIWFFTWQWNTYVAQYIPEYRYALIAMIVSNISFVFLVINILLIVSATPPPLCYSSLIL